MSSTSAACRPCSLRTRGMMACFAAWPQLHCQPFCPSCCRCWSSMRQPLRISSRSCCVSASRLLSACASASTSVSPPPSRSGGGSLTPLSSRGCVDGCQDALSSLQDHKLGACCTGRRAQFRSCTLMPPQSSVSCRGASSCLSRRSVKTAPTDCIGSAAPPGVVPVMDGMATKASGDFISTTAALNSTMPLNGRPFLSSPPAGTAKSLPEPTSLN
mmetsp:Transcript_64087/g.177827  ORF Transcript_64087/g.177827 Transcript_64087/m.177827 type:complete len:215 (+) Transcript_64087:1685-2329(+)